MKESAGKIKESDSKDKLVDIDALKEQYEEYKDIGDQIDREISDTTKLTSPQLFADKGTNLEDQLNTVDQIIDKYDEMKESSAPNSDDYQTAV